ncbi:restriction endonuclease subunit S [Vibrio fluvialis]|jgi:type I restriction enzyme S subunit|nr:restriction endonuclease subunit S [Vibrio fluvialis]
MVPNGWKEVKLGDVISHQKGFAFKSEHYCDEGKRIIRISDTDRNSIHDKSPVYINDNNSFGLERYVLSAGDIILSTVGSRPHLLDSMVGKAVQIPPKDEGSLLNQNLVKISPKKKLITNNYLFSMLKKNKFNFFISTLVRGNANQVSITLNELFSYKFLLPTYDEQRKIAKILSTWDKAIATTERLIATSQQQKKALMQQLLTGKKRVLNPETGKMFEGDWEVTNLGSLAQKIGSGVTPKGGSESYKTSGIPLIRSQNVLWGKIDLSDVAYIDKEQHQKMKGSVVLRCDVLLNITGASIGRVAVSDLDEANVNQHVCIIRSNVIHPEYLKNFLLSFRGQKQIEQFQAGGNRQGLNFEQIKSFKIFVCSLSEQQKIASVLTAADKEIELLQAKLAHLKDEKKALMQQLLTGKRRVKVEHTEAA